MSLWTRLLPVTLAAARQSPIVVPRAAAAIAQHQHAAAIASKRSMSSTTANPLIREDLTGADSGVAVLTLANPTSRNALSRALLARFQTELESLRNSKDIRVLVIRSGIDKVFCAGADLKERLSMTPEEVGAFVTSLRTTFSAIEELPIPTIAAIDGAALGGGLELALACDIRVAGETAKLGLPETKLAIIPGAGGTQRLPRVVGVARAKELIFTARVLDPATSEKYGLVQHAVQGVAYAKALEIAREILPKGPVAIKAAKVAVDNALEGDRAAGMILEQECYAKVIPTLDRLEGLLAFKEKREPKYKGH
ncbi:methylglutaconyl-CoA hydratase [Capsaspora owczarzaki ATCC 30864]|uniref:Methylglutaconyl-CoA hydratase n=1 Tax=Capsaspora owczarzaki (strain ATCC 30864) TaxID=595528 RepID=A0A0D2X5C2_CAPO3|nr:methylglutaconyl-CoA hydratase [Capsaspora owczarzaki ATCC 30864]KJE97554.1 methylglutaconyl-CoA hydratase [Capsaspora owczarzaki ATCC 30864]|eukprot:XP_004343251.1 methylglutaconyl-CoA hydratase [Capsaspora owczarzaki ATCC 30864]